MGLILAAIAVERRLRGMCAFLATLPAAGGRSAVARIEAPGRLAR